MKTILNMIDVFYTLIFNESAADFYPYVVLPIDGKWSVYYEKSNDLTYHLIIEYAE